MAVEYEMLMAISAISQSIRWLCASLCAVLAAGCRMLADVARVFRRLLYTHAFALCSSLSA